MFMFIGFCGPQRWQAYKLFNSMITLICILMLGLTLSSPVIAADNDAEGQEEAYIGADVGFVTLDVQGATYNPVIARARLGVNLFTNIMPKISLESHLGFNVTDDTNAIRVGAQQIDATLTLNYFLGLYGRASMDLSDTITAYGLVGFTTAQISGDTEVLARGDTESSLSLGVGGLIQLPFGFDGFIEVTQLVSDNNFDAMAIGLGIMHKL